MLLRPQVMPASASANQTGGKASATKLGIVWKAFHVLFWLFFLVSLAVIPLLILSGVSAGLDTVQHLLRQLRRMNALTFYKELYAWLLSNATARNMFLIQSIATCYSLGWCVYTLNFGRVRKILTLRHRLLWRAWQTLWKPVPELISTLGVEVPDAPEVSLAGIRSDAITLHWSPPGASKPVIRYGIQVNGVNGKHEIACNMDSF
jgi:hypothetical protein